MDRTTISKKIYKYALLFAIFLSAKTLARSYDQRCFNNKPKFNLPFKIQTTFQTQGPVYSTPITAPNYTTVVGSSDHHVYSSLIMQKT